MSATARRIRENTDPVPPPKDDVHRQICRQLKMLTSSLVRRVDLHMQPLELTGMQWEPLMLLWLKRADTVAALARVSQVGVPSMTRMLDRLEKKGLVRRARSPEDRRKVILELTAAGKALYPKLTEVHVNVLNRFMQRFTKAEADTLGKLLERMLANG